MGETENTQQNMTKLQEARPRKGAQSDPYVLDASYIWSYYADQSPTILHYVAQLKGLDVKSTSEPFTYCELGCGNGVTCNILADAFPHATFYGIDLNPEHIANARRFAEMGGLTNITYIEGSFADLPGQDLPAFDIITLHGVYSWVTAKVRQDIVRFIDKALKPGGLAYVSYNAMPGWAPLVPLRQIMLSYTSLTSGDSLDQAAKGLRYLKFLRDNKASFFQANPNASRFLDDLLKRDPAYIVHEYFNQAWEPMYFPQVATEMARAGLKYCGSTEVERNYTDVVVPKNFLPLLESAEGDLVRETHKSLILNEMFRRDVYCKIDQLPPRRDTAALFSYTVFGSAVRDDEIKREIQIGTQKIRLAEPIYDALIPAATGGTLYATELAALPELKNHKPRVVTLALQRLVAGGQFRPYATKSAKADGRSHASYRIPSALNRAYLEERLFADSHCFLASPVLGGGVGIDLIQGLLLLAMDSGGPEGVVDRAVALLAESGKSWQKDGKEVSDASQLQTVIADKQDEFHRVWAPLLLRYGIIRSDPG